MSFDIFWDKLDRQVAQKVQVTINEHFRTTNNKPSFIGNIEISDFDFGTIPPSVEIVDITDPFPEFYLPDNTVVEVDVKSDFTEPRIANGVGSGVSGVSRVSGSMKTGIEEGRTRESVVNNGQQIPHHTSSSSFSQPNPLNDNKINKPPITPIITSTITSPSTITPSTITPSSPSTISDASADYLYHQRRQRFRNSEVVNLKGYNHQIDDQLSNFEEEEEVPLNQDTDSQINVTMIYKGNMKMIISTELHMNYPSLMFMSLPVRLTITGFEFSATAVIAYLRNRINFCFLEPKDSEESLLKNVHIESEIGDKEKVLKNVGKLEKFIVDQLRKIIDEEFVFPSYYSIDL